MQYEELGDFVWSPVGENAEQQYVDINPGEELEMVTSQDYIDRMQFWEDTVGLN